jgi:ABC-type Fe3+-hydroxamate transport system substrate-binding protein
MHKPFIHVIMAATIIAAGFSAAFVAEYINIKASDISKNNVAYAQQPASGTRIINHSMGITEITGTPQRIIAIGPEFVEHLLTLGVQPIGIVESTIFRLWYPSMAEQQLSPQVADLGDYPPNLEAIAQLQPDLIIAGPDLYGELYEDLSSIAPTVMFQLFPEPGHCGKI